MSGIVGSYFNTRGSGVVAKLGTDGQVFTSTGAGLKQGFEAAAGGGSNVYAELTQASTQANISEATWTQVVNMAATLDSASKWDTSNDKYVIPSDGRYYVRFHVYTGSGSNNVGYVYIAIYVADDSVATTINRGIGSGEWEKMNTTCATILDLNTDDELKFYVKHTSQSGSSHINNILSETGNATQGGTHVSIIKLL